MRADSAFAARHPPDTGVVVGTTAAARRGELRAF